MDTEAMVLTQEPVAQVSAIDRAHLAHVTLGDDNLEREVLTLFDRQAVLLMARIRSGSPTAAAGLAHTLKGSASGIGAWAVARAADAVELAATRNGEECDVAVSQLAAAMDEARAAILTILQET
jgi:HPt (histidine-containing phosphotransfer) domain-containing protein